MRSVLALVAVLGLTAAACATLVPRWGLQGAAWATCLFYGAQAVWKGAVVAHALGRLRRDGGLA